MLQANEKPIYGGRYFVCNDGTIRNACGRKLNPGLMSRGYLTVSLYDGSKPKKPKSHLVHRLVAEAFLGKSSLHVNHKNGNKQDNRIENLEFVTPKENTRHAIEVLGKNVAGDNSGRRKLSSNLVAVIRSSKKTCKQLATELKMSEKHINDIRNNRYWKEV